MFLIVKKALISTVTAKIIRHAMKIQNKIYAYSVKLAVLANIRYMANGMLRRVREREVMRALLTLSAGKERFLASPKEIAALMPPKKTPAEEELEKELAALAENGYVDYVATDRKGERTYVLELSRKGADYFREERDSRRRFALRIAVAALCGAASALAGFLLKLLFS